MKISDRIDYISGIIWGYSFMYAFIFVNIFVSYLLVESINVRFDIDSSRVLSYISSLILTYLITLLSRHTLGSKGIMSFVLKRSKSENNKFAIRFIDSLGGFFICGLLTVISGAVLGVVITKEVVDSSIYYQYLIMITILTNLIFMTINVIRNNF